MKMMDGSYNEFLQEDWERQPWNDAMFAPSYAHRMVQEPQNYALQDQNYEGDRRYMVQDAGYGSYSYGSSSGSLDGHTHLNSYPPVSYPASSIIPPDPAYSEQPQMALQSQIEPQTNYQQMPSSEYIQIAYPPAQKYTSPEFAFTPQDHIPEDTSSARTSSDTGISTSTSASTSMRLDPTANSREHTVQCTCGEILRGPHANGNLTRHRRSRKCTASDDKRVLKCEKCDTPFRRSDALLNHKRKKHGAPPGTPRIYQTSGNSL